MGLAGEPLTGTQRLAALVWIPAVPMLLALFLHIAARAASRVRARSFLLPVAERPRSDRDACLSIPGIVFAIRVALRADTPCTHQAETYRRRRKLRVPHLVLAALGT